MPNCLPATILAGGWYSTVKVIFYCFLGENNQRLTAQDLDKLQGKLGASDRPEGRNPDDNPFIKESGARAGSGLMAFVIRKEWR